MTRIEDSRIAIIGLGYVGLPLAVEFGKQFDTTGYDIRSARVAELSKKWRAQGGDKMLAQVNELYQKVK